MKACRRKYIEWGAAGIGALALFLFFFRILPYHLFHREQTQLFLLATEPLAGYLRHPAALARLSGDFLTQFFYYEGGGPTIMAVVLLLWGGVSFVGSVHGTLGVDSYGVGGGLGGRKAMRIELSTFRHNRFNRYRRCFVVVS